MRRKKHLQIRSMSSSEVDLENWNPKTLEDIHISLDVGVGVEHSEGEFFLSVILATPEALRVRSFNSESLQKHTVIIQKYNYKNVKKSLMTLINKCNRDTRFESCEALQEYFSWDQDFSSLENTH